MPLGDSITEVTCWRALLWESLALAGLGDQVEFVGSMVDNLGLCLGQLNTVLMHHEGHIGFLASDIANYELPHWLNMANPDIVMFMLGTNDIQQGHRTNDILAAYTTMVQEMRANNPKMKIIVGLLFSDVSSGFTNTNAQGRSRYSSASPQSRSRSFECSNTELGPVAEYYGIPNLYRRYQYGVYGAGFEGWRASKCCG